MKFMGIIIATNMVSLDKNIGNGSLSGSEIKINYKKWITKWVQKRGEMCISRLKIRTIRAIWKKCVQF